MKLELGSWRLELSLGHHETDEDGENSSFVPDFRRQAIITHTSKEGVSLSKLTKITIKPGDLAYALQRAKLEDLYMRIYHELNTLVFQVLSEVSKTRKKEDKS